MGISRSATVICAYLIATTRMTPREALAAVRAKRSIVSPNMGFLRQLEEYTVEVQRSRVGVPRPKQIGDNVAEAIRKLSQGSQKELVSTQTTPSS
jgi:atypical dual specificity phosphatase